MGARFCPSSTLFTEDNAERTFRWLERSAVSSIHQWISAGRPPSYDFGIDQDTPDEGASIDGTGNTRPVLPVPSIEAPSSLLRAVVVPSCGHGEDNSRSIVPHTLVRAAAVDAISVMYALSFFAPTEEDRVGLFLEVLPGFPSSSEEDGSELEVVFRRACGIVEQILGVRLGIARGKTEKTEQQCRAIVSSAVRRRRELLAKSNKSAAVQQSAVLCSGACHMVSQEDVSPPAASGRGPQPLVDRSSHDVDGNDRSTTAGAVRPEPSSPVEVETSVCGVENGTREELQESGSAPDSSEESDTRSSAASAGTTAVGGGDRVRVASLLRKLTLELEARSYGLQGLALSIPSCPSFVLSEFLPGQQQQLFLGRYRSFSPKVLCESHLLHLHASFHVTPRQYLWQYL